MMFDKLFSVMKKNAGNDIAPPPTQAEQPGYSKRKYTRRNCDTCVSNINGQSFPVVDWSLGGLQVAADSRMFNISDTVDVTLKFKLSDSVISIPHKAEVVRKTSENIGLKFRPLTRAIHDDLQHVVDDYRTSRMAGI